MQYHHFDPNGIPLWLYAACKHTESVEQRKSESNWKLYLCLRLAHVLLPSSKDIRRMRYRISKFASQLGLKIGSIPAPV